MDKRCSSSTASLSGKEEKAKTFPVAANILPKLEFPHCKHCIPVPDTEEEEEEGCDLQSQPEKGGRVKSTTPKPAA